MHPNVNDSPPLKNRRIIFLLTALDMGGAERQALMLAQALHTEYQAHVEVWGLGPPGPVSRLCTAHGIPWRSFAWTPSVLDRLRVVWRLAVQLRRARPEILLPYTLVPNALAGLLWRLTGARSCIWNQRDAGLGLSRSPVKRLAVKLTPRFVSNSRLGATTLGQRYNLPLARIEIVPNGVELAPPQQTAAEWRAALALAPETLVVGMAANLTPYKDHKTLLRAWRLVLDQWAAEQPGKGQPEEDRPAKQGAGTVLLLAGQPGPTAPGLAKLAQELGIDAHVRFLGPVEDMAGWLEMLDVGVHSSKLEGTPNAILEYMAAGLPVVATDIPPIRDIFAHRSHSESAAWLAAPGDASALAQALLALLQDRERRRAVGTQNRHTVAQYYSPQQMIVRMVQIIAQELGLPSSKRQTSAAQERETT